MENPFGSFLQGFLSTYTHFDGQKREREDRDKQNLLAVYQNALEHPNTTQDQRQQIFGQMEQILKTPKGSLTGIMGNLSQVLYGQGGQASPDEGAPQFRNLTPEEQAGSNAPALSPTTALPRTITVPTRDEIALETSTPTERTNRLMTIYDSEPQLPSGPSGMVAPTQIQTTPDMRDFYREQGLPPTVIGRRGQMTNADLALQAEMKRAENIAKIQDRFRALDDARTMKAQEERDKRKYEFEMVREAARAKTAIEKLKLGKALQADYDATKEINKLAAAYQLQGMDEQSARLQASKLIADQAETKLSNMELQGKNVSSQIKARDEGAKVKWASLQLRAREAELRRSGVPAGERAIIRSEITKNNTLRKELDSLEGQVSAARLAVSDAEQALNGLSNPYDIQNQNAIIGTRQNVLAVLKAKRQAALNALNATEQRLKAYEQYFDKQEGGYKGLKPQTATPTISGNSIGPIRGKSGATNPDPAALWTF